MNNQSIIQNQFIFSKFEIDTLDPMVGDTFKNLGKVLSFNKNDYIYREGASSRGAYLMLRGMIKVSMSNHDGTEQIVLFFAPGELFGYRYLLSHDVYTLSAICLEKTELIFLDRENFIKLLDNSPAFTRQILTRVCQEFTILVNRINLFAQKGIRERLAFALLVLNEKFKSPDARTESSNIRITRTNLAAFIGTSLDVVSRNLKYYEEKNIISIYRKNIRILDFDLLYASADIY